MTIEDLIENFQWIDEWEDRYAYIIDLGKKLPEMAEEQRNPENKVDGCMSQVWMTGSLNQEQPAKLEILADSDAFIVKGLIAILLIAFGNKTPQAILDTDIEDIFSKLQLDGHLSPNRRNGFYAMIQRIRSMAAQYI